MQAQRQTASTILRLAHNYDLTRAFTRLMQLSLADNQNIGLTPFLQDLGQQPNADPFVYNLPIESVRLMYITSGSGNSIGHQTSYTFTCNALYLVSHLQAWFSWMDFIQTIGPTGCDPTTAAGTTACACYIVVKTASCNLATNALNSSDWKLNLQLTNNTCQGTISTPTPVTYYDGITFLNLVQTTCTAIGGPSTIIMGAVTQQLRTTFVSQLSTCTTTWQNLASPIGGAGIAFGILSIWETAYALMIQNSQVITAFYDGVMAQGASFRQDKFVRAYGSAGSYDEFAYMSYGSQMDPVYRLTSTGAVANAVVVVSGFNSASVGAASITPGVTVPLTSYDNAVIGDPGSTTSIVNAPFTAISLSNVATVRENTYTYAMVPDGSAFTYSAWLAWNYPQASRNDTTGLFNHYAATLTPNLVDTTIDPSTGMCVGAQSFTGGSWCDIRSAYRVTTFLNQQTSAMGLQLEPRGSGAAYTFDVVVTEGTISQSVVSACASLAFQATGAGTNVLLTNSLSTTVRLAMVLNAVSRACYLEYPNVYVGPQQVASQFFPFCHASMLLDVYYYDEANVRHACSNMIGVNITTTQSQYLAMGNAPVPVINQQTQIIADSVNTAMIQVFNLMQSMILETTSSQLTLMVYSGLPVPNATAFFQNVADSQREYAKKLADIIANNTILSAFDPNTFTNATKALDTLKDQNSQLNETLLLLNEQVAINIKLAALESVTAQQMNVSLANLEVARAAYVDAEIKWSNAVLNWAQTSLDAFKHLQQQAGSGFGALFGSLVITALAEVCGLGKDIIDGIVSVADDLEKLAEKVWDGFVELVKKAIDTLGGIFSKFISDILIILALVAAGCIGAAMLYKWVTTKSTPKGDFRGSYEMAVH